MRDGHVRWGCVLAAKFVGTTVEGSNFEAAITKGFSVWRLGHSLQTYYQSYHLQFV